MNKIVVFFLCLVLTTTLLGQPNHLKQQDKSKPFVLGLIDEIQSSELSEKRILNIYLPEGYDQNDARKYPVIYFIRLLFQDTKRCGQVIRYGSCVGVLNFVISSIRHRTVEGIRRRELGIGSQVKNIFEEKILIYVSCGIR